LSDRAWGTVREDYSEHGTAWEYLPHDHARSRAFRWNEDGIAGICDRRQNICFALALWNGKDPILKERLFGLTGNEGNHGEDVKECYYYLDSTPTHSYMRFLYKYPQAEFPYARLVEENRKRTRAEPEFELTDTGVFDENRYFDVTVTYAKSTPDEILIRLEAANRGPEAAELHLLPTVWFRNQWSWKTGSPKPALRERNGAIEIDGGRYWLECHGADQLLFCENETNTERLHGVPNANTYAKDGINDFVIHGAESVNPAREGTKAAAHYKLTIAPGATHSVELRLTGSLGRQAAEDVFALRAREADAFYSDIVPANLSADARNVMRQAIGGLFWSKQFYHYVVKEWMEGDSAQPAPPEKRRDGRNREWSHLYNADVISMPDKWEYPWNAAWDLAFHCVPIAIADPDFAKEQLMLMVREWYMHPNGQLPAYEWAFGDVNPPVHAWAAWRVYKIEKKRRGRGDRTFLQRIFHKLLLNFTWWVNRKDAEGRNIFQGGFLGLDNIGVFDRSAPLPTGGHIEQADGTGWMAMYSLNMLTIALELADEDPAYEDVASKFWEHFLYIANAMNRVDMWDAQDGFFYDVLHLPNDRHVPMKLRSMVGLIPLFAVETLEPEMLEPLPGFKRRMDWFFGHRPELTGPRNGGRNLLSIVNADQLRAILRVMLDENEFLSPFGVRALSKHHKDTPFVWHVNGDEHRVAYEPGESSSGLFGGNSNWRGPVWMPVNYLLVESLQKFHHYFGEEFRVEYPTGSGNFATLNPVAAGISRRLTRTVLRGPGGSRPVHGNDSEYAYDPQRRVLTVFIHIFMATMAPAPPPVTKPVGRVWP